MIRRPRLSERAVVRRHLDGATERVVVLAADRDRRYAFGAREWKILRLADGTRDLDAIVLALAASDVKATRPNVEAFFDALAAESLVSFEPRAPVEPAKIIACPPSRPLDVLSDFSLHCDGSGSCCRFYGSVVFTPREALRARALLPDLLAGGDDEGNVFTPAEGSGHHRGLAVAHVDGRCVYLGKDDRCGLHAAAGPTWKPFGCRAYPATFVDDGEVVRVSVAPECACLFASVDRPGGEPIVDPSARVAGDLDPLTHVSVLPEAIAITSDATASRADFVAWSRALAVSPPPDDAPLALFDLASTLTREGLIASAWSSATTIDLAGDVEALRDRAEAHASEEVTWRSERDLAGRTTRWIAASASLLLDPDALAATLAPRRSKTESFYVRALLHGHRFADATSLAASVRDRALRMIVARALPIAVAALDEPLDKSLAHPLALVEAAMRGHLANR